MHQPKFIYLAMEDLTTIKNENIRLKTQVTSLQEENEELKKSKKMYFLK